MTRIVRLLIFLLALAVVGYGAFRFWEYRRAEALEEALIAIRRMGGTLTYEHGWISDPVIAVRLGGLKKLTRTGLEKLARLPDLKNLNLSASNITDDSLQAIENLTGLEVLYVGTTEVGDGGLRHLAGLTNLEELSLSDTRVTDAGLTHLCGLHKLKVLYLGSTDITDAGLRHLHCLTALKELYLNPLEKVTDQGIRELRKAMPNLAIDR